MEGCSHITRSIIVDSLIISHYKYQLDTPQPGIAYPYINFQLVEVPKLPVPVPVCQFVLGLSKSCFIVRR